MDFDCGTEHFVDWLVSSTEAGLAEESLRDIFAFFRSFDPKSRRESARFCFSLPFSHLMGAFQPSSIRKLSETFRRRRRFQKIITSVRCFFFTGRSSNPKTHIGRVDSAVSCKRSLFSSRDLRAVDSHSGRRCIRPVMATDRHNCNWDRRSVGVVGVSFKHEEPRVDGYIKAIRSGREKVA